MAIKCIATEQKGENMLGSIQVLKVLRPSSNTASKFHAFFEYSAVLQVHTVVIISPLLASQKIAELSHENERERSCGHIFCSHIGPGLLLV
jgi:hypothetical protein